MVKPRPGKAPVWMEPIVQWLEELGLGQYGEVFVQAAIDPSVLPDLTEADLEKLGVVLGHRKKLMRAIAALSEPGQANRPDAKIPAAGPHAAARAGAPRRGPRPASERTGA